MEAKLTVVFLTVLMVQTISGRCMPRALGTTLPFPASAPCGAGLLGGFPSAAASWMSCRPTFGFGPKNLAASRGILEVSSSSPIPPSGVSVYSENAIDGKLAVSGTLPFLGTVAVEGALPTYGCGKVAYEAGNGNVVMTRENAF